MPLASQVSELVDVHPQLSVLGKLKMERAIMRRLEEETKGAEKGLFDHREADRLNSLINRFSQIEPSEYTRSLLIRSGARCTGQASTSL
jgi:hypothetical protein